MLRLRLLPLDGTLALAAYALYLLPAFALRTVVQLRVYRTAVTGP